MTKVDHGWQERGPKPHLPEPPLDDFDPILPFEVDGTIVNRTAVALRWARAWKTKARQNRAGEDYTYRCLEDATEEMRGCYQRIAELEGLLRGLVVQWEECEKLRVESGFSPAEYISIPVQNKAMRCARKLLDTTSAGKCQE